MSNKDAGQEVLVWDGNSEALPDLWQRFVYKDGETQYVVGTQDGTKYVADAESGDPNLPMSIRMFPGKTDSGLFNVLFKTGVASAEELAKIAESEDGDAVRGLIREFVEEVIIQDDMVEWTRSKRITTKELHDMAQTMKMSSLIAALDLLL